MNILHLLIFSFDKKHITVRLLEHDRNDETESKIITRKIDRIVKHKNYNAGTFNNDIALIRMDQEVKLGKSAEYPSPICLPTEGISSFERRIMFTRLVLTHLSF